MHILYGIQGTGNGHISRASAMFKAFSNYPDIKVSWLLSGRDRELGCGLISNFAWREGITFVTANGRVQPLATLMKNNVGQFFRDIRSLDFSPYDLVVSDFEPVICHAARKRGVPVTGIGHQYAFAHNIPMEGTNPFVNYIMNHFAPVSRGIGLHWHHFNAPILPPIIDLDMPETLPEVQPDKVIVYLPFENLDLICSVLQSFTDRQMYIYHPQAPFQDQGHLHLRPISRDGFKQDLMECAMVMSNSGFELISECLHLGKRILSKPLNGQMEQLSNAAALRSLGYADVIRKLDSELIGEWLYSSGRGQRIEFADVAAELCHWLANGQQESPEQLAAKLWQQTEYEQQRPLQTSLAGA